MNTGCLTQIEECHTSQLAQSNKTHLTSKKFLSVESRQKSQPSSYLLLPLCRHAKHLCRRLQVHAKPVSIATMNTLCHSSLSHTRRVRKPWERGESLVLCHLPFISLLLGGEPELGFGARPAWPLGTDAQRRLGRQLRLKSIALECPCACLCGFELLCSGTEQGTAQVSKGGGGWGSVTALLQEMRAVPGIDRHRQLKLSSLF